MSWPGRRRAWLGSTRSSGPRWTPSPAGWSTSCSTTRSSAARRWRPVPTARCTRASCASSTPSTRRTPTVPTDARAQGPDPARAPMDSVTTWPDQAPLEGGHGPAMRLATRQSALALAQTRLVADALLEAWPGLEVELVPVVTEGDRRRDVPTTELGGKGVFTAAVQQAVLEGRADLAVHSAKDLPALQTPGLALAAVPEREDPCDVLVTKATATGGLMGRSGTPPEGTRDPLDGLPSGSRVGTGSPRRVALLSWLRPDLELLPLRGNVDTRVGKVLSGELDAVE